MAIGKIEVRAEWDAQARVWVATSDDVPGLVTESESLEALRDKLSVMIRELLEANGVLSDDEVGEVPLHLIAYSRQLISLRD